MTYNYGDFSFADLTLAQRIAYDSSGNVEYVGYAHPGSLTNKEGWMIYKLTYSGSSVVAKTWAGGSNWQDKIWDNYAAYTYI